MEYRYFDKNGAEIAVGCKVFVERLNRVVRVYSTECVRLGYGATNPSWVERGLATEWEYGIYPFNEGDIVEVIA